MTMSASILITGYCGLIGSEVARYFHDLGFSIDGIDNNQRAIFLGTDADIRWNQRRLMESLPRLTHHELDMRDRPRIMELVKTLRPAAIVHAAAQPSHDRAAAIPFDDFDTNAVGTLNLLEAARQFCPESPFIYLSTNKVYGDLPNKLKLKESETRWEFADSVYAHGISESFSVDQSTHSLMGASKLAADIMVQEYGRYFGMPTCCLRGGCLTGPNHSGVEMHGFLSYLVKTNLEKREYTIFGYKGKQVRDHIHAVDVARFIHAFSLSPRSGEVYNMGGGVDNSCSILEGFTLVEAISGQKQLYRYVEENRKGDHICYYSDLSKIRSHYPQWAITKSLRQIICEIIVSWQERLAHSNTSWGVTS